MKSYDFYLLISDEVQFFFVMKTRYLHTSE